MKLQILSISFLATTLIVMSCGTAWASGGSCSHSFLNNQLKHLFSRINRGIGAEVAMMEERDRIIDDQGWLGVLTQVVIYRANGGVLGFGARINTPMEQDRSWAQHRIATLRYLRQRASRAFDESSIFLKLDAVNYLRRELCVAPPLFGNDCKPLPAEDQPNLVCRRPLSTGVSDIIVWEEAVDASAQIVIDSSLAVATLGVGTAEYWLARHATIILGRFGEIAAAGVFACVEPALGTIPRYAPDVRDNYVTVKDVAYEAFKRCALGASVGAIPPAVKTTVLDVIGKYMDDVVSGAISGSL